MKQIEEKLFCESHKKKGIFHISLEKDEPNPFYCSTCMIRRDKSNTKLVEIEDILKSDLTQPIYNWPPGILKKHIDFMENKQTDLIKNRLRDDIMTFYDSFESQLKALIFESRKQQLMELDIKFVSMEIIDFYNIQFKRSELIAIFQNLQLESKDNYKQLLDSVIQSSPKDLETLDKMIKERKRMEIKFREFQDQNIQELQMKISSIIDALSLNLFDKPDYLFEKYNYKKQSDKLSIPTSEINKSQNKEELSNGSNIFLLQNKIFLCKDDDTCDIEYFSNFVTKITNIEKNSGYIQSMYQINPNCKQSFKLTFIDFNDLTHFNFGFGAVNLKSNKCEENLFKDFWKVIVKQVNQTKDKIEEFHFWVLFDLKKCTLKLKSNCFDEEKIQKFKYYDRTENEMSFLFDIIEDFETFYISEYQNIQ